MNQNLFVRYEFLSCWRYWDYKSWTSAGHPQQHRRGPACALHSFGEKWGFHPRRSQPIEQTLPQIEHISYRPAPTYVKSCDVWVLLYGHLMNITNMFMIVSMKFMQISWTSQEVHLWCSSYFEICDILASLQWIFPMISRTKNFMK